VSETVSGELLVLASAYLCAVQAGDAHGKRLILSTVTGRELLAGLSLVGQVLTAEYPHAAHTSTSAVLDAMHRDAVRRHRQSVLLASPQDPVT
jgi:hypothetical protein